jgi:hypothetical protein
MGVAQALRPGRCSALLPDRCLVCKLGLLAHACMQARHSAESAWGGGLGQPSVAASLHRSPGSPVPVPVAVPLPVPVPIPVPIPASAAPPSCAVG